MFNRYFHRHVVPLCFILISLATFSVVWAGEYWQQEVYYSLDVELDTEEQTIHGDEVLHYYNNSPDTLNRVYFHLYQNAYTEGSYLDMEYRKRGSRRIQRLTPETEAGTKVHSLTDQSGDTLTYLIDNTIMRVDLPEPLLPGDSTEFRMEFTTRFGGINRRVKREKNT